MLRGSCEGVLCCSRRAVAAARGSRRTCAAAERRRGQSRTACEGLSAEQRTQVGHAAGGLCGVGLRGRCQDSEGGRRGSLGPVSGSRRGEKVLLLGRRLCSWRREPGAVRVSGAGARLCCHLIYFISGLVSS